jgi:flotillin
MNLKKAIFDAETKKAQAQADKAYDIQANVMQQQVIAEQVKVQQVERMEQVKVQEAEILRREKELIATVLKQAEIEKQRVETIASAQAHKIELEAMGQAASVRAAGQAEADIKKLTGEADAAALRARGMAEAEVVLAKGKAEAEAMQVKAAAYKEYGQAAILDKMLPALPELMRAAAEPLSKIDKVTILSQGNGEVGINKFMGDIAKVVATAPALVETLTGLKISDLLSGIPGLSEQVHQIQAVLPAETTETKAE